MKSKLFLILVFFFCQISTQVQSQLTERQIFTELFVGCVQEGDPNMTLGAQFEYCACIISNMSTGLTYDELIFFVEGGEASTINKKINKFAEKCIEQVYQ
tara:strand:- start:673 stop:972 length:300 start_codon:yes stop_codon:yes gene_type:complete